MARCQNLQQLKEKKAIDGKIGRRTTTYGADTSRLSRDYLD
jgi:hypothetical protein